MNPQNEPWQQPPAPQQPQTPQPYPPQPGYQAPPVVEVPVPGHGPLLVTPNQPVAPHVQPAVDKSPYDFIMSPDKPSKIRMPIASGGGSSNNSKMQRVFVVVGGLILLIIIVSIVASLIGNAGKGKLAPLQTVAQEQNELIRVSSAAANNAKDETTQALAYNIQISTTSSYQQLVSYLSSNHTKINQKLLGSKHLAATDTELQSALANGTYDSTVTGILQHDLASYQQALKTAYAANPGPKGRQLLSTAYNGAALLLTQSQQNTTDVSTDGP